MQQNTIRIYYNNKKYKNTIKILKTLLENKK